MHTYTQSIRVTSNTLSLSTSCREPTLAHLMCCILTDVYQTGYWVIRSITARSTPYSVHTTKQVKRSKNRRRGKRRPILPYGVWGWDVCWRLTSAPKVWDPCPPTSAERGFQVSSLLSRVRGHEHSALTRTYANQSDYLRIKSIRIMQKHMAHRVRFVVMSCVLRTPYSVYHCQVGPAHPHPLSGQMWRRLIKLRDIRSTEYGVPRIYILTQVCTYSASSLLRTYRASYIFRTDYSVLSKQEKLEEEDRHPASQTEEATAPSFADPWTPDPCLVLGAPRLARHHLGTIQVLIHTEYSVLRTEYKQPTTRLNLLAEPP